MTEFAHPPEDLAIRGKPASTRRFSKRALGVVLGGASLFVFGALAIAMSPAKDISGQRQELYSTTNRPTANGLARLPVTYADMQAAKSTEPPLLGPPLPGDLGAPILQAQQEGRIVFKNRLTTTELQADDASKLRVEAEATLRDVRSSEIFFTNTKAGRLSGSHPVPTRHNAPHQQTAPYAIANSLMGGDGGRPSNENFQIRKHALAAASGDVSIYNQHRLETPISPWQVMAGTVIPASLITGVNSDLPGQVTAQVTEPVYDTVSGGTVLIPQGARIMGRYDSVVAYGQSRALIVWHRIIMPNGSSIRIENLPAVDGRGHAGLSDGIDNHSLQLFSAAALSTLISIGAELSEDDDDRIARALRDAAQDGSVRVGEEIVRRQIAVRPTLTIRPGWRLSILVHQDIILKPYGDP